MRHRTIFYAIPTLMGIAVLAWLLQPKTAPPLHARVVAAAALEESRGFARAEQFRALSFPADHGPHDDYQIEWWYYTGNLEADTGEHFGYQLTFFRRALAPPGERVLRGSTWGTEQVYMAHFAVTDVAGAQHHSFERFARGAAGLAGAQAEPFRVWLEDWSVTQALPGSPETPQAVHLSARTNEVALSLSLQDHRGPVLQGDHGYSRKGPAAGNASYYYSQPRMVTQGAVTVRDKTFSVEGTSWMDHEFSTSALGPELAGWDWFSVQLSDGSEVMLYALRQTDGGHAPFSSGTLIAPDGTTRLLGPEDFVIQATGQWRSPRTGGVYPSGWVISVSSADLRLTITPYLVDQEMRTSLPYWEGAVKAEGALGLRTVDGSGYVELTGYARSLQGQF